MWLIVPTAVLAFYAGWRAAAAYLQAASAVSDLTNAMAQQSNSNTLELERSRLAQEAVTKAIDANTEVVNSRQKEVELALRDLYEGFLHAGFVRRPGTRGRQVGEAPTTDV